MILYIGACKSLNDTICNVNEGTTVQLVCAMHHPCNSTSFQVRWYKSPNETFADAEVIEDIGEEINNYNFSVCKYVSLVPEPQNGTANGSNSDNCCFTTYVLSISNFNSRDNGHYWCQFVDNDSHPLSSPYGYITLSEETAVNISACTADDFIIDNEYLNTSQCAENITMHTMICACLSITTTVAPMSVDVTETITTSSELFHSSTTSTDITITPTSDITPYTSTTVTQITIKSKESTNYGSETVYDTSGSTTTTSHGTTPKENNLLMYGAIAGAFVCFCIVLLLVVMCCATLFCKYRKLKKKGKYPSMYACALLLVYYFSFILIASGGYDRNRSRINTSLSGEIQNAHYTTVTVTEKDKRDDLTKSTLREQGKEDSSKHRFMQGGYNRNKRFMMDTSLSGEIQNPHYTKTVTATEKGKRDDRTKLFTRRDQGNEGSTKNRCVRDASMGITFSHGYPKQSNVQQPLNSRNADSTMVINDGRNEDFVNRRKESASFYHKPTQHGVVNKDGVKESIILCKPLVSKQPLSPPTASESDDKAMVVSDSRNKNCVKDSTSLLYQPPHPPVVDKDRKPAPVKCKPPILPLRRKDTATVVSDNADFVYCIKDSTSFLSEPPQHPVVMYLKDKKIAPVKCKPPVLPPGQKETAIVVSDEHNENFIKHKKKSISSPRDPPVRNTQPLLLPSGTDDNAKVNCDKSVVNWKKDSVSIHSEPPQRVTNKDRKKPAPLKSKPAILPPSREKSVSDEKFAKNNKQSTLPTHQPPQNSTQVKSKPPILPPSQKDTARVAKDTADFVNCIKESASLRCEPQQHPVANKDKKPAPLKSKQPILPPSRKDTERENRENEVYVNGIKDSASFHHDPPQHPVDYKDKKPAPAKSKPVILPPGRRDTPRIVSDEHNREFVLHETSQTQTNKKENNSKLLKRKQPLLPPSGNDGNAVVNGDKVSVNCKSGSAPHHSEPQQDPVIKPAPLKSKQPILPPGRKATAMVVSDNADFVNSIKDSAPLHCEPPQHLVVSKDKKPAPMKSKPAILPPSKKDNAMVVGDGHNENFANNKKDSETAQFQCESPQPPMVNEDTKKSKPVKSKQALLPLGGKVTKDSDGRKDNINRKKESISLHCEDQQHGVVNKDRTPKPTKSKQPLLPPARLRSGNNDGAVNTKHLVNCKKDSITTESLYSEPPQYAVVNENKPSKPKKSKQPLLLTMRSETNDGAVNTKQLVDCKKDSTTAEAFYSEPPQYAVVNKVKKKVKPVKNKKPLLPPNREKTQDTTSKAEERQERSPSPVYAEPIIIMKKQQQLQASSVKDSAVEERSASPEYAEVDDVNTQAKAYTTEGTEKDVQHYYHSLEDPIDGQVRSKTKGSTDDVTHKGGVQHYYHILEGPVGGKSVADVPVSLKSKAHGSDAKYDEGEQHHYHILDGPISGKGRPKTKDRSVNVTCEEGEQHHYHILDGPTIGKSCSKSQDNSSNDALEEGEQHLYHILEAPIGGNSVANEPVGSRSKAHRSDTECDEGENFYHILEAPVGVKSFADSPVSSKSKDHRSDTKCNEGEENLYHILEAPTSSNSGPKSKDHRSNDTLEEGEEHLYHILEAPLIGGKSVADAPDGPKSKDNIVSTTHEEDEHFYHILEAPSVGSKGEKKINGTEGQVGPESSTKEKKVGLTLPYSKQ